MQKANWSEVAIKTFKDSGCKERFVARTTTANNAVLIYRFAETIKSLVERKAKWMSLRKYEYDECCEKELSS